jgi:hypothetical protein
MKANMLGIKLLSAMLGIALVGSGVFFTKSYLDWNELSRSKEQFVERCDALVEALALCRIQLQAQATPCAETARSLDELLAARITNIRSELASADAEQRLLAQSCFDHIARQRSKHPGGEASLPSTLANRHLVSPTLLSQTQQAPVANAP